jgi:hypothetical protein
MILKKCNTQKEGNFFNLGKATNQKPTSGIILSGERLNTFPPMFRNKKRMAAFTISSQHSAGLVSQGNRQENKNERHPDSKGKSKTTSISHTMTLYRKTKKFTKSY